MDSAIIENSFHTLLDKCLEVTKADQVLVLFDEDFEPFRAILNKVLIDRGCYAGLMMIPKGYQLKLLALTETPFQANTIRIPDPVRAAIFASTVVLNVLNGDMETTSVRRAIIQQRRDVNCRFAHIPGVSADILAVLAASPIDAIARDCEHLAWLLGEGHRLELVTKDQRGAEHTLSIRLDGWDSEPIMSPGVIPRGGWGNIPPGETFCCPALDGIEGTVCINGSVPGHVLTTEDEMLLKFSAGRLAHWFGQSTSRGIQFLENEQLKAKKVGDLNWNCFAELGIGLNPTISALTGNSLFDEKVAGTVHIALGDNSGFGHTISSALHADLVTRAPTLRIDGRAVIQDGVSQFDSSAPRVAPALTHADDVDPGARVYLREARAQSIDGELWRRLTSANRVSLVRIADEAAARSADLLANQIGTYDRVLVKDLLRACPTVGKHETLSILRLLYHYRVLGIEP